MRDIPGALGYQIDKNGTVYFNGEVRKGTITGKGYVVISLKIHGERKTKSVHRLMACTYLGMNLEDVTIHVDHKDGVKSNNRLDNLEVVSCSENRLRVNRLKYKDPEGMKTCRCCKQTLPVSMFGVRVSTPDGLHPYCYPCNRAKNTEAIKKRKEK